MLINNNSNLNFTSLRNPIKSFDVKTHKEVLHFSEINYNHSPKNSFYNKLAEFFLDNFANTSSHPFWLNCRKPTLNVEIYNDFLKRMAKKYKLAVNNPDTTILLAKDKSKNIVAAIFTRTLRESEKVRDWETLYIDSIAVAPEFRHSKLGKLMLNKVIDSSKNRFTDAFLVAYRESQPFYEQMGFNSLNHYNKESERFVIEEMAKERIDYPEYAEFMTKKLQNTGDFDWLDRIRFRNFYKD